MLLRKRFIFLLASVVMIVVVGWLFLEWRIHSLESDVWNQGGGKLLTRNIHLVVWVRDSRVLPVRLKARARALVGDFSYFNRDFRGAREEYMKSVPQLVPGAAGAKWDTLTIAAQLIKHKSAFAKGFSNYVEHEPPIRVTADDDLLLPPREGIEASSFPDLLAIPAIERELVSEVQKTLSDLIHREVEWASVRNIVEQNAETVNRLHGLAGNLIAPEDESVKSFAPLADFVRLLLLDAALAANSGDTVRAEQSLSSAYRLIGCCEKNPTFVLLLVETSLRQASLGVFESEAGSDLRSHFAEEFAMREGAFVRAWKGEYRTYKRIFEIGLPVGTLQERRIKAIALQDYQTYARRVLENGEDHGWPTYDEIFSEWMVTYRRHFFRPELDSAKDGAEFAKALEELEAQTVSYMGIPTLGPVERTIAGIRNREAEILEAP